MPRIAGSAVTNTALQIVIVTVAGRVLFGLDWPDFYNVADAPRHIEDLLERSRSST